MGNESSLAVRAFLRLQYASGYFFALVVGFTFEKWLEVSDINLFVLLVVLGLLSVPWQRVPFFRVWLLGVPIRVGFVGPDGSENDEPPAWNVSNMRLNRRVDLVTSGEVCHRVLEVDDKYRVTFCDDTGTTARWREADCSNGRRRYITFCFGNYQSQVVGGGGPVPMREQIIVERAQ